MAIIKCISNRGYKWETPQVVALVWWESIQLGKLLNCHLSQASTFNAIQGRHSRQMLSAQTTVTWVNVCYITTSSANVFPCSNLRINSSWQMSKKKHLKWGYKQGETQPVTALLNKSLEGRWHRADKSNLRSPSRIDRLLSRRPILRRRSDTLHLLTGVRRSGSTAIISLPSWGKLIFLPLKWSLLVSWTGSNG